jgi:type IV pilus assembly protein PilA
MLVKMRESKGFTLVELMIVVAIIGILAAVAVPYYQRYVAKSRLTSLVMPAVHATETNISTYFAVQGAMPPITNQASLDRFLGDADTHYVTITPCGTAAISIEVNTAATNGPSKFPLKAIGTGGKNTFRAQATADSTKSKLYWKFAGTLADELGL